MLKGQCHCGAVTFELSVTPFWLTQCTCSICRRVAALWAHSSPDVVTLTHEDGATETYIWGDRMLAFHRCRVCGCTTHWKSLTPEHDRMAVNARMCEPEVIANLRVRTFDGADRWEFLD